jgi:hypothetical protein
VQRNNQEKTWESFHKSHTADASVKRWKWFSIASIGSKIDSVAILPARPMERFFLFFHWKV